MRLMPVHADAAAAAERTAAQMVFSLRVKRDDGGDDDNDDAVDAAADDAVDDAADDDEVRATARVIMRCT